MDVFYSSKGGSGCSTAAAATALLVAKYRPTLLVDLAGEQEQILGLSTAPMGVTDWLGACDPPPDSLARLELEVTDGLSLLPFGSLERTFPERVGLLGRLLRDDRRAVVVDVGTALTWSRPLSVLADRQILVTRACYLSATRARRLGAPDVVIVVKEAGRALTESDIRVGVGATESIEVPWKPAVARAVDAGLGITRFPSLLKRLGELV